MPAGGLDEGAEVLSSVPAAKPTSKSTVAEIEEYAKINGIDLEGCSNKSERLERIEEAGL